jgi:hypothetical protein
VPLDRITFSVGALGCNCTIVSDPETKQALVIDPGDEAPEILAALARAGLTAVKIVHTHAHFDHVMGTGEVAAATGADVLLHHNDRWLYDNAPMQMALFGLARARRGAAPARDVPPPPTLELRGDEAIAFGRHEVRAIHTPGGIRADAAAVRGRHALPGLDRAHRSLGRLAHGHQAFDPRPPVDPARHHAGDPRPRRRNVRRCRAREQPVRG